MAKRRLSNSPSKSSDILGQRSGAWPWSQRRKEPNAPPLGRGLESFKLCSRIDLIPGWSAGLPVNELFKPFQPLAKFLNLEVLGFELRLGPGTEFLDGCRRVNRQRVGVHLKDRFAIGQF